VKLSIIIDIEPEDATKCGTCHRAQLDGTCGAFEHGGTERETLYDEEGLPLWADDYTLQMRRLPACSEAAERATELRK